MFVVKFKICPKTFHRNVFKIQLISTKKFCDDISHLLKIAR